MANNEKWPSRRKVGKHSGDVFKLDTKNKTPEENIKEIIQGLYLKKTIKNETSPTNKQIPEFKTALGLRSMHRNGSDNSRLSYLNALVTLLCKEDRNNLGFTIDELMKCIRISLVDESMVIRTAALRVLRYLIKTEADVATFNNLRLPYLVARSIDLMLRNEEERAQALRVIRRVVAVVGAVGQANRRHRAAYIDAGLLRCLAAVARAGSTGDSSGDRLARPAIATLAEICVLNPELFISCGGVNAVTRQLAECATPRMAEALCGVLLHTLNEPSSRESARIDLTCLSSPYCDFHFRPVGNDTTRDEREMRFTCSRLSLLCVLRSWPGLLHFCHPCTGGLHALVAALYLPRLEVRKAILDLLYELVGLPQPEWTDEISVALNAVDPSDFQDSWRLNEGFVAAEGTAILPHLSATGPDITEIHLALLLQCFLEAGLLDGLAEVIVTSDTFISVRATVLLGQLMHLIHLFLPLQITPALPSLMSQASAGKPQALAAIAALKKLHSMLESRPASNSLFLDNIIQYCSGVFKEKHEDNTKSRKEKDNAIMAKPKQDMSVYKDSIEFLNESDSENEPKKRHSIGSRAELSAKNLTSAAVSKVTKSSKFFNLFERESDSLIRCSLVMQNKDGNTWNWEIIRTILKETDGPPLLNLNDSGYRAWVARIISYLKPSSNKYSHTDLTSTCHGHSATRAGCQLIRHLLRHNDFESQRLLEDLFLDVNRQIEAIETGRRAHECLFSPNHMCNTMCQMYFLFIGQLCHTHTGLRLLKKTNLYNNLLDLSTRTHHSCYVKLVISSLDYTLDSYPREILYRTLTCNIQASRLYATQFLNVLLRASHKSRELIRKRCKQKKSFIQERIKTSKEDSDNDSDMDTWVLQMLVGQVKDESKSVMKCALAILEEAYSVPGYPEKLIHMREALGRNCRLDKETEPAALDFLTVGDSGYLLWLSLEIMAASQSTDPKSKAFIKKHLDFWDKTYNYRYVRLVEARAHAALGGLGARRGLAARRAARPPPHALAAAPAPRPPRAHAHVLQRKKWDNEQEILDMKASLWALGNYAITPHGFRQLMTLSNGHIEDSVPLNIVKLAKNCPVYSLRATALYVLGMIGSTYDGANLLAELGWLSVRHTRHDQFPVVVEELYSFPTDNTSNTHFFTSPDRRYNLDYTEISEHSDHTDHSTADSLPSDNPRNKDSENNQDVVDHKGFKEPDKRKSYTLPTQGCSSSHDRPTMSESRTVDILRDCSNYERPAHRLPIENRLLIGRMNSLDNAHEGRVRNTSESSTSGVSSCDSFLGKYAIPDRVLTLSPIPSSSSLYGMKSSSSSHKPRLSESLRRTSTSSFTAPDIASSPPTSLDMTGYATLMSLNKNRRPHLSESAASGSSDMDDLSWLLSDSNKRYKTFSSLRERSKVAKERMAKMSVLEYDWRPQWARRAETPRARAPVARAPPPAPPAAPAYIGICLPNHLASLLCNEDDEKEKDHKEERLQNLRNQRLPNYLADVSIASNDNRMRTTPDSQKFSSRGLDMGASSLPLRNNITNAAVASAVSNIKAVMNKGEAGTSASTTSSGVASMATVKSEHNDKGSEKNLESRKIDTPMRTSTPVKKKSDTNALNEKELMASISKSNMATKLNSSIDNFKLGQEETKSTLKVVEKYDEKGTDSTTSTNSTTKANSARDVRNVDKTDMSINKDCEIRPAIQRWRHVPAECLACVRTRPPSSHELREAFFAEINNKPDSEEDDTLKKTITPQAEVMNHAHFMSNPIHFKQTRTALLSLKQRHPDVFRSPCVYSDICALISRDTYMLCARRFLQELFLDTNFDCFALEPATKS